MEHPNCIGPLAHIEHEPLHLEVRNKRFYATADIQMLLEALETCSAADEPLILLLLDQLRIWHCTLEDRKIMPPVDTREKIPV
jgi:hypothetical protein